MTDRKVSSLVACAIASARATEAVGLWIGQLTDAEFTAAYRKLRAQGEHHAADILTDVRREVRTNGPLE